MDSTHPIDSRKGSQDTSGKPGVVVNVQPLAVLTHPPRAPDDSSSAAEPLESISVVSTETADSSDYKDFIAKRGDDPSALRVTSIYDVRSAKQKWFLLALASAVSMLLPFANTMYMPSLAAVRADLHTTETMTAASISVYMFAIGAGSLGWGTVADRFGRRWTLYVSSVLFLGFTTGCVFSRTIVMLIVFRALQGLAVAAFGVSAQAVVADVFPPHQRGKAIGIVMLPTLVGPVVGPLVGGGLAQAFNWRATFVAMAIMGVVVLVAVLVFMEETHHYHVLKRVRTTRGHEAVAAILESATTTKPEMVPPYKPFVHLLDPVIAPHTIATITLYGTLFACMIVLPYTLAAPPYHLSQWLIGVCNMALGVGLFVSAPLGGAIADRAAKRWSSSPSGRMLIGLPIALAMFPLSVTLFGWAMHFKLHLAIPLTACLLIGLGIGMYAPCTSALISITKQQHAAAAGGAQNALMFMTGGLFVLVTPKGMATLGHGPFVTLLAALSAITMTVALVDSARRVRRGRRVLAAAALAANGCVPLDKSPSDADKRGRRHDKDAKQHRGRDDSAIELGEAAAAAAAAATARQLAAMQEALGTHTVLLRNLEDAVARVGAMLGEREAREVREVDGRSWTAAAEAVVQSEASVAHCIERGTGAQQQAAPPCSLLGGGGLCGVDAGGAAESSSTPACDNNAADVLRPAGIDRHIAKLEAALDEHNALLRGNEAHARRVEAAVESRGVALRQLENRVERMEQLMWEHGAALKGGERAMERRLAEQGATLRELLGLVRGLR